MVSGMHFNITVHTRQVTGTQCVELLDVDADLHFSYNFGYRKKSWESIFNASCICLYILCFYTVKSMRYLLTVHCQGILIKCAQKL